MCKYVHTYSVGAVYYTIGNMQPSLRSNIHGIQLLILAKYNTIQEYGIDKVLSPLVEDIHKLVRKYKYPTYNIRTKA